MTIIKLLTIALSFFTLSSCKEKTNSMREIENLVETKNKTPIKYLALGDSYTICQNVAKVDRWPNQLGAKLKENNFEVDKIDLIAQTGWTTSNLLTAINNTQIEDYSLVSLLIGVNNQFQNKPFTTFQSEFDLLLDTAIAIAGSKDNVFVVSIPDYRVTPFGNGNSQTIAQDIDEYNDFIRTRCNALDILFINVTEISRTLGSSNGALTRDNLHPSATQYAEWVNEMLPQVLELLVE
jgi:lysophospholipase L1-like esterase